MDKKIKEVCTIVSNYPWFDFDLTEFNGYDLEIIGSTDMTYFYELRLLFKKVFYISCSQSWHIDTKKPFIEMVDTIDGFYANEENKIFKIFPEDFEKPFYIIAQDFDYEHNKVLFNTI